MKKVVKFRSLSSYFTFAESIKRKARYVFEDEVNSFVGAVLASCEGRKRTIKKGGIFWRAQQGHKFQEERYFKGFRVAEVSPPERMKPLQYSAKEGRVNPKGIPCLYLSTDKETAMTEVRPWISSLLSVGMFKVLKNLVLIDCSVDLEKELIYRYIGEPFDALKEDANWEHIGRAFSEPVDPHDSFADYAPTQVLAEAFRSDGYDGIIYKSLLGTGSNIALFDIETADLMQSYLYEAMSLSFQFEEIGSPEYIKKYVNKKGASPK